MNKLSKYEPIASDLKLFCRLAEAGNILRASEQLSIQQSGLTKVIQRLEQELQTKLFHRSPRGVRLTDFGVVLYNSLRKTKDFWNDVYLNELKHLVGVSGELKLGVHSSVAANCLADFYPDLVKKFSQLDLKLHFFTSIEVTRRVANFDLDLGIVVNPVRHSDLVARKVFKEYIQLWSSNKQYSKVIVYNPDTIEVQKILRKYKDHQLLPVSDYEVIASLIKDSQWLGVLPNPIAARYGLMAQFEKLIEVDVAVIWRKDRFANSLKKTVVEFIIERLKT